MQINSEGVQIKRFVNNKEEAREICERLLLTVKQMTGGDEMLGLFTVTYDDTVGFMQTHRTTEKESDAKL